MTNKIVLLLSVCLLLWCCQDHEYDRLDGLWIGSEVQMDQNMFVPLSIIVQIEDQKASIFSMSNMSRDTFPFFIQNQILHVDTVKFLPHKYSLSDDVLRYNPPYYVSMYRAADQKPHLGRIKIRNILRNSSWQMQDQFWHFQDDQTMQYQSKIDADAEIYCWRLIEEKGQVFLGILGNQLGCDQVSFPVYQILDVSDSELTIRWMEKQNIHTGTVKKLDQVEPFALSDFQLCNRHLYINQRGHHYYYKGVELVGGHYKVKKILDEKFHAQEDGFTGVIRIRFIINCEGKTGRFETMSFDPSYNAVPNPGHETEQLLNLTKELGPWIPGKASDNSAQPIDTYIFIAYKLKNGKVVDILP